LQETLVIWRLSKKYLLDSIVVIDYQLEMNRVSIRVEQR